MNGGRGLRIDHDYALALAMPDDITDMLELQGRNLAVHGGTLSIAFPRELFQTMIAAMPAIVARRAGCLVGYVLAAEIASQRHQPIVAAMLRVYSGSSDAYFYGPICVDEAERGRGVARLLFAALCAQLPGREGITFIRSDNVASLQAHKKMGWHSVGDFTQDGIAFVIASAPPGNLPVGPTA
jgi:predicted GNAT superfamily acetyltransferase